MYICIVLINLAITNHYNNYNYHLILDFEQKHIMQATVNKWFKEHVLYNLKCEKIALKIKKLKD